MRGTSCLTKAKSLEGEILEVESITSEEIETIEEEELQTETEKLEDIDSLGPNITKRFSSLERAFV